MADSEPTSRQFRVGLPQRKRIGTQRHPAARLPALLKEHQVVMLTSIYSAQMTGFRVVSAGVKGSEIVIDLTTLGSSARAEVRMTLDKGALLDLYMQSDLAVDLTKKENEDEEG